MATIFNQGLYKRIGIEFEYKASFQEFLTEAIGSALVSSYNTGANTPAARTAAKDSFVGCGPSMGFEAKKFAYETLELVVGALVNNADVPAADKTALNDLLIEVTRYVGIAGEEDFHFMVATFQLAEVISRIIGEVVPAPELPVGTILTLELIDGGSGYTYDGTDNTTDGVTDTGDLTVTIDSTESTNPAGYTAGEADVEITSGAITSITVLTSGGGGFGVGQVVTLNVDTTVHAAGTQDTPAMARVLTVS